MIMRKGLEGVEIQFECKLKARLDRDSKSKERDGFS